MIPATPASLTALGIERNGTTAELMRRRVALSPEKVFLRWQHGTLTYGRTWECAGRIAAWLLSRGGDGAGARVAGYIGNRPEVVCTWLGCHRAGRVYVSLNREHKGVLLADIIGRSGASVLLCDATAVEDLPDNLPSLGVNTLIFVDSPEPDALQRLNLDNWHLFGDLVAGGKERDGPEQSFTDVASVMFTSGTTGRSKAVLQTHGMLCRGAGRVAEAFALTEVDVFHCVVPPFHIVNHLHVVMATLIAGGEVALYPRFSLSAFWDQVVECRASVLCLMSTQVPLLLQREVDPRADTVRLVVMGPQPDAKTRSAFEQKFGMPILDTYGMTEVEPVTLPVPGEAQPAGCCGRANPDFEVAVIDRDGYTLPFGAAGELVVRPRVPDVMMRGYENDAQRTLEVYRGLWLHTGDQARIEHNGDVYITGRIKEMIRRRGENISVTELEQLVLAHPQVTQCAALGVPSELGEEDVKIVVVCDAGSHCSAADLRRWCEGNMARFMVPRYIEFRDSMPLHGIGKINKEELRRSSGEAWDFG